MGVLAANLVDPLLEQVGPLSGVLDRMVGGSGSWSGTLP